MASTITILAFSALLACSFSSPAKQTRNFVTNPNQLWDYGVVPIVFDDSIDGFTLEKVLASIAEIQMSSFSGTRSCISFVPRTNEADYVTFTTVSDSIIGDSEPGRMGGNQPLHLYPNINKADIMQLLVYTLGAYNEFRRPDRDGFVTVNYENISPENRPNFAKNNGSETTYLEYPFDYNSITMYFPYAFAADPSKPSMQARYETQSIPWTVSLSQYDVSNLQRMYGCGIDIRNRIDLLRGMVSRCNFEFDFCDWTQEQNSDDFEFQRQIGPTKTPMTGPQADFSSGIGYYVVAVAKGNHNKDARILSPTLPAGDYCLKFYYYMYGAQVHKARVLRIASGSDEVLVELEGNQGNLWHRYMDTVSSSSDFQFALEAVIGGGDEGDMAFDDVYILKGKCLV